MLRSRVSVALLFWASAFTAAPVFADSAGPPVASLKWVVAALARSSVAIGVLAAPYVVTPPPAGVAVWSATSPYESISGSATAPTAASSPRFQAAPAVQLRSRWQLFGRMGGLRWRSTLADCLAADLYSCTSIGVRPNGMPKLPGSLSVGLFLAF